MAAFAPAEATLGSTTEARKATVDMIGFPALLNGIGCKVKSVEDQFEFPAKISDMPLTLTW